MNTTTSTARLHARLIDTLREFGTEGVPVPLSVICLQLVDPHIIALAPASEDYQVQLVPDLLEPLIRDGRVHGDRQAGYGLAP